jgi:hypothetical protein
VPVAYARDHVGVGQSARNVAGSRECADAQRPVLVLDEHALEVVQVWIASVRSQLDGNHEGATIAPRQDVGVVFKGTDEHDRL